MDLIYCADHHIPGVGPGGLSQERPYGQDQGSGYLDGHMDQRRAQFQRGHPLTVLQWARGEPHGAYAQQCRFKVCHGVSHRTIPEYRQRIRHRGNLLGVHGARPVSAPGAVLGHFGAVVFRGLMIVFGVALINRFEWIIYVFGVFLLYTAFKMLKGGDHGFDPKNSFVFRQIKGSFR